MSRLILLRRGAALAAAACALAPASALAADAPSRTIARGVDGAPSIGFRPVAVSADGRTVIGGLDGRTVMRDVSAGTTTPLFSGGGVPVATSDDLRYVLVDSTAALTSDDTDGTEEDAYLLDRATGSLALVSGIPARLSDGQAADRVDVMDLQLSGDGRFASFVANVVRYDPQSIKAPVEEAGLWRWDRATGGTTKVAALDTAHRFTVVRSDTAGKVAVTDEGIYVAGRRIALPAGSPSTWTSAAVSADGTAVAVANGQAANPVLIVNTATGATTSVTVPTWLQGKFGVQGVGNGGSGFLVSTRLARTAGTRDAFGWITRAGTLTQVGADVPATTSVGGAVISSNLAFAANGLVLAKLGAGTLPGTEPGPNPPTPLTLLTEVGDAQCFDNLFGGPTYQRAWVQLNAWSAGYDPRIPASASVRVFSTANPETVYNAFTLAAGKSRELTVPRVGGWTVAMIVTFTDGSTLAGSRAVAPHAAYPCEPVFIG